MAEVYYFGCWEQAGHHMRDSSRRSISQHEAARLGIPSDHDLDGGPMFLPQPERKGIGMLTYLPACNVTVLAWWGSPWDQRGAVNAAVLVRGQHDADAVWQAFEVAYPSLAPKLQRPTLLRSSTTQERK